MTLRAAIEKLQTHAKTAGANDAPVDPTETAVAWPFSVCYPASGKIIAETAGAEKDLHTLFLDLHVNRQDLPTDVYTVLSFLESFKPLLIADPTLGDTVDTIQMGDDVPISYEFGEMSYGSTKTVGLRFTIIVKQKL